MTKSWNDGDARPQMPFKGTYSEATCDVSPKVSGLTDDEILARILGDNCIDDVLAAFNAHHPARPYSWSATAELEDEVIIVTGRICHRDLDIGHFSRRLTYARGVGQAFHEIMEIEREHRDKDIAKYHYARALAFY